MANDKTYLFIDNLQKLPESPQGRAKLKSLLTRKGRFAVSIYVANIYIYIYTNNTVVVCRTKSAQYQYKTYNIYRQLHTILVFLY